MIESNPHVDSYYAATANRKTNYPQLKGAQKCDVCVIGGGITGLSWGPATQACLLMAENHDYMVNEKAF